MLYFQLVKLACGRFSIFVQFCTKKGWEEGKNGRNITSIREYAKTKRKRAPKNPFLKYFAEFGKWYSKVSYTMENNAPKYPVSQASMTANEVEAQNRTESS